MNVYYRMCFVKKVIWFLVLNVYLPTKYATAVFEIQLNNLLQMQHGLGWPHTLNVTVGHEALLKLSKNLEYQQSCMVTTPEGVTFNVASPPSSRYEAWGDSCGVRVRNVLPSDEGRWRITAAQASNSITGFIEVHVKNAEEAPAAPPILLQDGQTHVSIGLSSLQNSYCVVAQPFADNSLVPGQCSVMLDRATRAVQGNWNVLLGLPGRVSELQLQRTVTVEAERLDVGYIHSDNNKLHLYCNIQHTTRNITFCRFQKTTDTYGYNVVDGLSDGVHSYYGDGFSSKHCGLTIENVSSQDYGTWRCSVGVQQWVGTAIVQQTPLQALIKVDPNTRSRRLMRSEEERELFVQENFEFSMSCHADVSLAYCWFQHPNGSQYTPVPRINDEQLFWQTGQNLQMGDCEITFLYATEADTGEWVCHMGPRNQMGVEFTDRVSVRVTGPLAAVRKDILVDAGAMATLYCHSSNGNRPLQYCRFMSPNYLGITIDSTVTEDTAILDRFYFTPERSLDYGDCSLTINPVLVEDVGEWTCAAIVDNDPMESRDTIALFMSETGAYTRRLSQAGIVGMVMGLLCMVAVLGGYVLYRRVRPASWRWTGRSARNDDVIVHYDPRRSDTTVSSHASNSNNSAIQLRNIKT